MERIIGMEVGPFRLAFELADVRQILSMGGAGSDLEPRSLGVTPVSLAAALGQRQSQLHPALLLLDGELGPILCSVCRLTGIRQERDRFAFPTTAALLWPGMIKHGITTHEDSEVYFVLNKVVLMAIIQAHIGNSDSDSQDLGLPPLQEELDL